MFAGMWRKSLKLGRRVVARLRSNGGQNLRFYRSVDEEAVMAMHVHEHDLEVRNLRRHVGGFPELTAACVGTWLAFG